MPKHTASPPRLSRSRRTIRLPRRYIQQASPSPLRRAPSGDCLRRYDEALQGGDRPQGLNHEQASTTGTANINGSSYLTELTMPQPSSASAGPLPYHPGGHSAPANPVNFELGTASAMHRLRIERQQQKLLQEKDTKIEELRCHIRRLERSERRLKSQTVENRDRVANKDAELGEIRRALQIAEETLDEKEEAMQGLIKEVHHYQGWWLNEYYCLKVALKLARNQKDKGVQAMRESSQARFMKWSVSHQP